MTELLRVYNEIYKIKREYCVICLRSCEERRMVNIKTLEKFIQSINLPFNYIDEFQKVCYVCERAAAAAYRFRLAVNLSGAVHGLYVMMGRSRRSCEDIERQIIGYKPQSGVVRNVPEWETRLSSVRTHSSLLQTEVLVVNSLVMPGENVAPRTDDPGACADMYLIPDAAPAAPLSSPPSAPPALGGDDENPQHDMFEEPEIFMESVTLVDEEVDPIQIKLEEPITIEENSLHIQPTRDDVDNNASILSALLTNRNASSLVPIENLIDSPSTSNLALIPDEGLMQRNPMEPTNFLLHPIVEKDGMISVPSLAAQIINGQLVTIDNSNIVIQTPKLALQDGSNFNLLTDPNQVTSLLKSMSNSDIGQVTVVSDHISMDTLENNLMQSLSQVTVRQDNVMPGFVTGSITVDKSNGTSSQGNLSGKAKKRGKNSVQSVNDSNSVNRNSVVNVDLQNSVITDMESIIIYEDSEDVVSKRTQRKKEMAVVVGRKRQSEIESGKRSKTEKQASEKEALAQQWETDWEDKIPTEVISTMDGVDPNAATVLAPQAQPAPIISNVHTIRENVHSSTDNVHSSKENTHSSKETVHSSREIPSIDNVSIENVYSENDETLKESYMSEFTNFNRTSSRTPAYSIQQAAQIKAKKKRGETVTQNIRSLVKSVYSAKESAQTAESSQLAESAQLIESAQSTDSSKVTRKKPRVVYGARKGARGKVVADQSVCDIIDLC